jgi:hypothetical protein
MGITRILSGACCVLAAITGSAATADLHTFQVRQLGPGGVGTANVHVYELGTKYVLRAAAVQSEGINLAQASHANKVLPLAVSAGIFEGSAPPSGLITVQGAYLSRLAPPASLPTLLCFNPSGFEIRRASTATGKMLPKVASGCLSAIQSPALLVERGVGSNRSTGILGWQHVLAAQSASGDRIIIVEGRLSPAALTEFLGGRAAKCTSAVGKVTRQSATVRVAPGGGMTASCSLGLTNVAVLNSGRSTGAVHYGTRLSGSVAANPPVAILLDD